RGPPPPTPARPGGPGGGGGATTGPKVELDLFRVFLPHVRILGTSMGTIEELRDLVSLCESTGIEPVIDSVHPLSEARAAVDRLASGAAVGKVIIRP
ncbi:MAG: zinc-binding dehydrogenase, partial [Actinomycetia bacterium]|nr:zinc-binding dehydrogenase [Actinomycetes bacterium]